MMALSLSFYFLFLYFFPLVALWLASLGSFSPGRLNQQHHTHTHIHTHKKRVNRHRFSRLKRHFLFFFFFSKGFEYKKPFNVHRALSLSFFSFDSFVYMCVCLLCVDGARMANSSRTHFSLLFLYTPLYSPFWWMIQVISPFILVFFFFFTLSCCCCVVFYIRERHQYFHSERTCTIGESAFPLFFPIAMGDADWTKTEIEEENSRKGFQSNRDGVV